MFLRRYASVSYLVGSRRSRPCSKNVPSERVSKYIYTPSDLTKYFRDDSYGHPLAAQITRADSLFYNARIKHEWTCASFEDIPDVKVARLSEERRQQVASVDPLRRTEYHENVAASRTSFGVDPQLLRPLPEVLLLGHTNAGKSTLINSLFVNKHQASTGNAATEYAYVSKRAGYTKCLNSYNVGNKLRVIDSPGYGRFGEPAQGQVVLDYIRRRQQLRRTFVIIDSLRGVCEEDAVLVEYLVDNGAPFEIIFTKVDVLMQKRFPKINMCPQKHDVDARAQAYERAKEGNSRVVQHFQHVIDKAGLRELATLPRLLFNNSHTSLLLARRHGFRDVRFAIAESCNLPTASG
ncbi:putative GTP-binding protein engB [Metschnikowia bicuspidata var. bicuspidata NRRL YB-4993]|uniref:Putative GTP-binding protein engB n=1 Tax=Metschnikowia bicuspidata var. bicuspidata NRRL YB-4993 TaxID=869754 RepID=A0A1A0H8D1_9ASCO|nr:putative GTP-binding protein engB [Metschnikowia bicuspidata var. bicuspidata NRRL YB-4993]OBA20148.1 putative GTP-binding protein engB [Metschnikowia bicuspidata var. bicuspidata NRRL YB-4993]